jgi:hypothetical protein
MPGSTAALAVKKINPAKPYPISDFITGPHPSTIVLAVGPFSLPAPFEVAALIENYWLYNQLLSVRRLLRPVTEQIESVELIYARRNRRLKMHR